MDPMLKDCKQHHSGPVSAVGMGGYKSLHWRSLMPRYWLDPARPRTRLICAQTSVTHTYHEAASGATTVFPALNKLSAQIRLVSGDQPFLLASAEPITATPRSTREPRL